MEINTHVIDKWDDCFMSIAPDLTIECKAQFPSLAMVRKVINALSEMMGFGEEEASKLEMAVDEACANSIASIQEKEGKFPCTKVRIEIAIQDHCMTVCIIDSGSCFKEHYEKACAFHDATERTHRRGYGLQIIKTFMDEVHYIHEPEIGNKLILTKYLQTP